MYKRLVIILDQFDGNEVTILCTFLIGAVQLWLQEVHAQHEIEQCGFAQREFPNCSKNIPKMLHKEKKILI